MYYFGWLVATDRCPHLDVDDKAAFTGLLVMPWARITNPWNEPTADEESDIPIMKSEDARDTYFGDWLTPWKYGPVTWELWCIDANGTTQMLQAQDTYVSRPISDGQAAALRQEATEQLIARTAGHGDVFQFRTIQQSDGTTVPSLTIATGGLCHMPPAISEAVLGMSGVCLVAEASIPSNANLVMLPVFTAPGTSDKVGPSTISLPTLTAAAAAQPASAAPQEQNVRAVYASTALTMPQGAGEVHIVARAAMLANAITLPTRFQVSASCDRPRLSIYDAVARKLFPAGIWLHGLDPRLDEALAPNEPPAAIVQPSANFHATFLHWMGCGEDELTWPVEATAAAPGVPTAQSIFEILLLPEKIAKLFANAPFQGTWQDRLRNAYQTALAGPAFVQHLLHSFATGLTQAGLTELTMDATTLADAYGQTVTHPVAQAAWSIVQAMTSDSPVERAVWSCWLAAVIDAMAPILNSDSPTANGLIANLRGAALDAISETTPLDRPAFVRDDATRLLGGKLDEVPGFWETLHRAPGTSPTEPATDAPAAGTGASSPVGDTQAPNNDLAAAIGTAATSICSFLGLETQPPGNASIWAHKQANSIVTQIPVTPSSSEDPSLKLRFEPALPGDKPTTPQTDESLRGYLICVEGSLPSLPGSGAGNVPIAGWINAFAAERVQQGVPQDDLLRDGSNVVLTLTDTLGATMVNGLPDVETEYNGHSVFATPVGAQADNRSQDPSLFTIYNPVEPRSSSMPPLGYGLAYRALAVGVDNSGAVTDATLRGSWLGDVSLPPVNAFTQAPFVYQSRQIPALPRFGPLEDQDLAAQTLTYALLAQSHAPAPATSSGVAPASVPAPDSASALTSAQTIDATGQIAVLYSGAQFTRSVGQIDLVVHVPACSQRFASRWLGMDTLADPGSDYRWTPIRSWTTAQVHQLLDSIQQPTKVASAWQHPAVIALRGVVTMYDALGNEIPIQGPSQNTFRMEMPVLKDKWLLNQQLILSVAIGNAPGVNPRVNPPVVVVPYGARAKIELFNVLEPRYFDPGVCARFDKQVAIDHLEIRNGELLSKSPAIQWVEVLPSEQPALPPTFGAALRLVLQNGDGAQPALSLNYDAPLSPVSARWLVGFHVEPKRWRWSGIPVDIPRAAGTPANAPLGGWLPAYAGTDNGLPWHPDGTVSTALAANSGWVVQGISMQALRLPAVHEAIHAGFEIEPTLRFARVLTQDAQDAARVPRTFCYALFPGNAPLREESRLPTPAWREAIPLTQTWATQFDQLFITEKGAMLLLDDAVLDTSDGAKLGGAGERFELDVVPTWETRAPFEIGVNPIFHAMDSRAVTVRMSAPIGLSADRASGGLPTQAALIVRPDGGAGKWLLARLRIRRYVEPGFRIDKPIGAINDAGQQAYPVSMRKVRADRVPYDVAIFATGSIPHLVLKNNHGTAATTNPSTTYNLSTPADPQGTPAERRYLVTWEKRQWGEADATWRARVALQVCTNGSSQWETVKVCSGFDQQDLSPPLLPSDKLTLIPHGSANVTGVWPLLMSDFTDARWVSFLGSFGMLKPGGHDQYVFDDTHDVISLAKNPKAAQAAFDLPTIQDETTLTPTLLMLFAPSPDAMRGTLETAGGRLIGVYASSTSASARWQFDRVILSPSADDLIENAKAIVIGLQRRHIESDTNVTIGAVTWTDLQTRLFPPQSTLAADGSSVTSPIESSMRLLPEYLGPISHVSTTRG